jgi:hypothetical protein
MAVSAKFYGLFFSSLASKSINLTSDTIKLMLCSSAYTPNQDTHQYKSDVSNEITGTGYTAGGATVASMAVSYDAGTNVLSFDANDVVWAAASITARYGVLYDASPGSDATRPLIGWIDFGGDVTSTGADFTIAWNASGIGAVTVA